MPPLSLLPTTTQVSISMLFYGATTGIEFLALLQLRVTEPEKERPFRVPIDLKYLPFFCVPPLLLWYTHTRLFTSHPLRHLPPLSRPSPSLPLLHAQPAPHRSRSNRGVDRLLHVHHRLNDHLFQHVWLYALAAVEARGEWRQYPAPCRRGRLAEGTERAAVQPVAGGMELRRTATRRAGGLW